MKNLFLSASFALGFIALANTGHCAEPTSWMGYEYRHREGVGSDNRLNGGFSVFSDSAPDWGFYGLFMANDSDFGLAYAGPVWRPYEGLQLAAGIGYQTAEDPVVVSFSAFAENGPNSFFGVFETGDSSWYRAQIIHRRPNDIGIGLMSQMDMGIGPYLDYKIPNTRLKIWGSTMFDVIDGQRAGNLNAITGIQVNW